MFRQGLRVRFVAISNLVAITIYCQRVRLSFRNYFVNGLDRYSLVFSLLDYVQK